MSGRKIDKYANPCRYISANTIQATEIVIARVGMISGNHTTQDSDYANFLQQHTNFRQNSNHYPQMTAKMAEKLGMDTFTL